MDKTETSGFIRRWSCRKQAVLAAEEHVMESTAEPAGQSTRVNDPAVLISEPELELELESEVGSVTKGVDETVDAAWVRPLTDADMPDLASLNAGADFSGFLSEGVSEALRRKALKKLFSLPDFQINDGLNDYDEDYSRYVPLGDTVTYQMKQWLERQKTALNDALQEEGAEEGADTPDVGAEALHGASENGVSEPAVRRGDKETDGAVNVAQQPAPKCSAHETDGLGEAEEGGFCP